MIKDTFKKTEEGATNLDTDSAVVVMVANPNVKQPGYNDDTPRQAPSTPAL